MRWQYFGDDPLPTKACLKGHSLGISSPFCFIWSSEVVRDQQNQFFIKKHCGALNSQVRKRKFEIRKFAGENRKQKTRGAHAEKGKKSECFIVGLCYRTFLPHYINVKSLGGTSTFLAWFLFRKLNIVPCVFCFYWCNIWNKDTLN